MNVSVLNPNVQPGRGRHIGRWWIGIFGIFFTMVIVAVYFGIEGRMTQQQEQQTQQTADPLVSADSQVAPSLVPPAPAPPNPVDDGFIEPEDTIDLPGQGEGADLLIAEDPRPVELSPYEAAMAEEMKAQAERWRKEMEDRHAGQLSGIVLSTRSIIRPQAANAQSSPGGATVLPASSGPDGGSPTVNDERRQLYRDIRDALANEGGQQPAADFQDPKLAFIGGGEGGDYLDSTRTPPRSPYELKASTVIPAVLITAINSDLPGQVVAQVSQNVYDTATGRHVLIPQGARLFGEYDSQVLYGQRRLLVVWRRLIFPDASSLQLDRMPGSDPGGFAGFDGEVKNHYWRIFGQITLLSALQSIPSIVDGNRRGDGQSSELESIAAANYSQAGRELLERNLSIKPRITVQTGYRFLVTVHRDIVFPWPWQE